MRLASLLLVAASMTLAASSRGDDCTAVTPHDDALRAEHELESLNTLGATPEDVERLPNVEAFPAYLARMKAARALLHCARASLNPRELETASSVASFADTMIPQWESAVASELACRGADRCMAQRVCDAVEDRRQLAEQLAHEKANPGGVVDLRVLHDLGASIQADDALIAFRKAQVKKYRGKAFAPSMCRH